MGNVLGLWDGNPVKLDCEDHYTTTDVINSLKNKKQKEKKKKKKATTEGTWEKSWTHRRDKVPVLGRGEEKGRAAIEYSLSPSECVCLPASREQCYPVHPPSLTLHAPALRPSAILEG